MSNSSSQKSFRLPEGRPALMGILNVTPDSFSDGGLYFAHEDAVSAALRMVEDGADLIDVGGESTRPGAEPVSADEELRRTIPVVASLAAKGVHVSIDTMKPEVAKEAVGAGAFLINDVSGFRNPRMVEVALEANCAVCVMHMQGEPRTMQANPAYGDVVEEVRSYLLDQAAQFSSRPKESVWIDPGIGFGKTLEHNLSLIRNLNRLAETGFPVLVGVSRKSFIGRLLNPASPLPAEDRLEGTLAAQAIAQIRGATVIRSHDVRPARRVIETVAAIQGPQEAAGL